MSEADANHHFILDQADMRAARKTTVDRKILQELVPLNSLSTERFNELSDKIVIEEVLAGRYLFRKGDRDNQSIFLLEGKINLIDGFRMVISNAEAGTDISRYPIANQQPRSLSARADKKVVVAKIDSSLLDVYLTWDQSRTAEVIEIKSEKDPDWMTRILQSEAFIKVPPSIIQSLLTKMETIAVKAGDIVISQGDSGDYFYTLHEGRCAVTRKDTPDGEEQLLAELGTGDSFGEDALVSDARRNATVSMLTDGQLMRLAKKDFVELLKSQLVKHVSFEQSLAMVAEGAIWLDVRTPDEYEFGALEDSVNIPLSRLRNELSELVFNSKYIICCDTGRRSESAGFLLSNKGFDVYVLEGGLPGQSSDPADPVVEDGREDASASVAEIIEFGSCGTSDERQAASVVAEDVSTGQDTDVTAAALNELRDENESLKASLQSYSDSEERLTGQIGQLREQLEEIQSRSEASGDEHGTSLEQLPGTSPEQTASAESIQTLQQLQTELEHAREKADSLEQLGGEKDTQIESLQQQLAQQGSEREAMQQELEALQQQQQEMQRQIEHYEERAKGLEQENNEAAQKAHDDLTRKNDNEKELQGQIDRLRKKLEQQTADHKTAREDSQSDIDNLREQLHAERQERAEERAEMAARQRELKEQFSVIATEHEANLTNQSGAIEQARDAVRQEEQERLREILAAQTETEGQVDRLQQELNKAHEEIAGLVRESRDRRQVDVELMEEQNKQAVATISQLESQLKQLTSERDSALEDQQSLRDKMNTLRGEVEEARGLMEVVSQMEDPARLRKELDESKKNTEIALRLRDEAEAARDQLLQERDALQESGSDEMPAKPLHVPSLDEDDADPPQPVTRQQIQQTSLPGAAPDGEQIDKTPPQMEGERDARQRRWPGAVLGLFVVIACALAGWLIIDVDLPLAVKGGSKSQPDDTVMDDGALTAVPDEPAPAEVQPVIHVAQPERPAKPPAVKKAQPAPDPVTVPAPQPEETRLQQPAEVPEPAAQSTPVTAGRSFRDGLRIGGQGPVMVELPAGSYEMGSVGNTLNYNEVPRHHVDVPVFAISKYEVTFKEYDRFARATGRPLPYDEKWGRGNRPVINVSWVDARAYARWLSKQTGKDYRLPSEAEWEYAARAGTVTSFWWQDDSENLHANCFDCGSQWDGARTAAAGSFAANNFGLHDVSGNVQEWTEDCYQGSYQGAPVDGSAWLYTGCNMRTVRGGGYSSPLDTLRSAHRSQYDQDTRLDNLGFRLVREINRSQ